VQVVVSHLLIIVVGCNFVLRLFMDPCTPSVLGDPRGQYRYRYVLCTVQGPVRFGPGQPVPIFIYFVLFVIISHLHSHLHRI
jgi:hypothetical protein